MPNFNDFVYESAKSESTIRISQQLLASYLLSSDYLMMPHLRKSLYRILAHIHCCGRLMFGNPEEIGLI